MIDERFIDLDELILLCKGDPAKRYIAEAVACYQAGAFRSCIVATWIAVVFDFVEKLKHLELAGDANAKKRREEFEKFRMTGDVRGSLLFERKVPSLARDEFELISDHECSDLERLLEDRNRCAHPSMNTADEVYSPAAELARAHLRNAVVHLLRHPPVQGKAALSRILDEIKSAYFPTSIDDVTVHFQRGPLANPRETLVRNLVIVLMKTLVRDAIDERSFHRHCAALNGVRRLHPRATDGAMAVWTNRLIRGLSDDRLPEVIRFLNYVPGSWDFCEEDVRSKMERVVEGLPETELRRCLPAALDMTCLNPSARKRIAYTTPDELCALVEEAPRAEYADRAVDFYAGADTDGMANVYGSLLLVPLAPFLGSPQVERVFACIASNGSVKASNVLGAVLRSIRDCKRVTAERVGELVLENGLDVEFEWLLTPIQKQKELEKRVGAETAAERKEGGEPLEGEEEQA
jgi:hypothetical protein